MIPTDAAKNRYADAIPPTMPTSGPMAWTPWSVEEFSAKLSSSHPHYRILKLIGHGGMGAVYQATDTRKGHALAIKVMRPDLLAEAGFVERFQREIQMLRELDHPHIVSLVDRGLTADGVPFLVMPYLLGRSLAEVIQDKERLTLPRILTLMQQICAGTAALHDKGIIHRDLKPANIFLRAPDDHAIILDLGIARPQMPLDGLHTQTGQTLGTESYMAPEVKEGKKAEKTADIYALGVILYQLLTQRFPVGNYHPPSAFGLDPRLDAIIDNAIHADPMQRYQSVTEFAEALKTIQNPATSAMPTAPVADDDSSPKVVIEIEDYRITINGLDLTFIATLDQAMEALGAYTRTTSLPICYPAENEACNLQSGEPGAGIYYWDHLGICAIVNTGSWIVTPNVFAFNVFFRLSPSGFKPVPDCLHRMGNDYPFVVNEPKSKFSGKILWNGDLIDSDSLHQLMVENRSGNFQTNTIARHGIEDRYEVTCSPIKHYQAEDENAQLDEFVKSQVLKDHIVRVSTICDREHVASCLSFSPITAHLQFLIPKQINLGPELGRRAMVNYKGIQTVPYSYPEDEAETRRLKNDFLNSFLSGESVLLSAPGDLFLPYDNDPNLSLNRSRTRDYPIFILTNRRILAWNHSIGWVSITLNYRPRLYDIRRISDFESSDCVKILEDRLDLITNTQPANHPQIKVVQRELAFTRFFFSIFKTLYHFFRSKDTSGNLEEGRLERKGPLKIRISSDKFPVLSFAYNISGLVGGRKEKVSVNYEYAEIQIKFLFYCADILIRDSLRKFPEAAFNPWLSNDELSSQNATQSRSLHPCPTCSKEVAKSARTCPHCGEHLRSGPKPSGWRQKACSNCGEVMSRFAQKCQQPDCGHPNTWLKVQSMLATLAVLGGGFWCWLHYTQQQTPGLLLPIAATVIALIWRGSLSLLKSFYSH